MILKNHKVLFVGIIILFLIFIPFKKALLISNRKNPSEKIYSIKAIEGFTISYTHSVNKGRVHDYYTCEKNGDLVVSKTVFVSYGAGIPEPQEFTGSIFEETKDGYQILNLNRRVKSFLMAVGVVAEHSISIDNKEFFLKDFFKPQTSLVTKVKRISLVEYITNYRKILR